MKNLYLTFVFLMSQLYLLFIPFGNYPIVILNTKVDILIGLLLFILTLPLIGRIKGKYDSIYLLIVGLYIFILLITVLFSEDGVFSLSRFFVTMGYLYVSFIIPAMFYNDFYKFSKLFFIYGLLSAIIGFILANFFGFNENGWERFTLPIYDFRSGSFIQYGHIYVDPTIYAFGLIMTLIPIIYFECMVTSKSNKFNLMFYGITFLLIMNIVILAKSRTTMLSISLALILTVFTIVIKGFIFKKRKWFLRGLMLLFGLPVISGVILLIFKSNFLGFLERINTLDSASNNDRIFRLNYLINDWMSDTKSIFLGKGYYYAAKFLDPHNIYLEYLYGSGILGLLIFFLFLFIIYFLILYYVKDIYKFFTAQLLFWYIVIGGLTYWHTKTFWVIILMLNFILIRERKNKIEVTKDGKKSIS